MVTTKHHPVQYPGLSFKVVREMYHGREEELERDILHLFQGKDLQDLVLGIAVVSGKKVARIARELECKRPRIDNRLNNVIAYELMRHNKLREHLGEGEPEETPLELMSIARLRNYGGIGPVSFKQLRRGARTARELSRYTEVDLLRLRSFGRLSLERTIKSLEETKLKLCHYCDRVDYKLPEGWRDLLKEVNPITGHVRYDRANVYFADGFVYTNRSVSGNGTFEGIKGLNPNQIVKVEKVVR